MAANGFSARKSNVREKLSDLFYLLRSFTATVNSSRDSLYFFRSGRKSVYSSKRRSDFRDKFTRANFTVNLEIRIFLSTIGR